MVTSNDSRNEMNERIKQLALEAFQPINDIASEGIADRRTFDQAWFQLFNQMFAELIVAECEEVVRWAISVDSTIEKVPALIQEHFGVE
jgi:DNA-binding SARP family transcriptional activator